MTWIYLIIAGLFEVVWATMMKLSNGFSHFGYAAATVVGMVLSFGFLALATKHLPLSIAYPIWTGIGAVGAIIVGLVFFKEANYKFNPNKPGIFQWQSVDDVFLM
ncbi:multidrug efflux SMR transporter, partial [Lactiplantibacillus plantarum]